MTGTSVVCAMQTMSGIRADTSINALRNTKDRLQLGITSVTEQHGTVPRDMYREFKILKKCQRKFDCLIYEMLFIKELKPTLNKQSDSIHVQLFV